MRRLIILLATTMVATLAWFGLARFILLPTPDAHWIQGIYSTASAAAEEAEHRVFLVGGSSAHYGLSAEQLSSRLHVPVINSATHAALGAEYLLYRAEQTMKTGDTVILVLEMNLLLDTVPSFVLVRYVQFYDWGYLPNAKPTEMPVLLAGTSPHDILRSTISTMLYGLYSKSFNRFGDATDNKASQVTPALREAVQASSTPRGQGNVLRIPSFLSAFVATARAMGVRVLAGWSPMLDDPRFHDETDPLNLLGSKAVYQQLGVPQLGDPRDFLFPIEDMYNTRFHLNDVGRVRATERLGDLLCEGHFECPPSG